MINKLKDFLRILLDTKEFKDKSIALLGVAEDQNSVVILRRTSYKTVTFTMKPSTQDNPEIIRCRIKDLLGVLNGEPSKKSRASSGSWLNIIPRINEDTTILVFSYPVLGYAVVIVDKEEFKSSLKQIISD